MTRVKFDHIKVGDIVRRTMGGTVSMELRVTAVDDDYITCGPWVFERVTGAEYDPDLRWGSQWGTTGSCIEPVNVVQSKT